MNENVATNDVKTNEKTSASQAKTRKATFVTDGEVEESQVIKRKDGRITNVFDFNEKNVTSGRYEQFETLSDMILFFIKAYKGKPIKDYIKVVQRSDKKPYETLRIPKAVREACYIKLKTFMVIEETQISAKKTQYYVKEVYDRAEIANKK